MDPTRADVHVSTPLTDLLTAELQDPAGFVAGRAFPPVRVKKSTDRYYRIRREDTSRDAMVVRAPGTPAAETGWHYDQDTFDCEQYALAHDIPDEVRGEQDEPLDQDGDATVLLAQQMLIRRERAWAAEHFIAGVWGTSLVGVAGVPIAGQIRQWDQTTSNPARDIHNMHTTMLRAGLRKGNLLVLGRDIVPHLLEHDQVEDKLRATSSQDIPTKERVMRLLAPLFDVDDVLIGEGVYNTAAEGVAESNAFILQGQSMLLLHVPRSPGIRVPSAGYTFVNTNLMGGRVQTDESGVAALKYRREETLHSDRVEIMAEWDHKLVTAALGVFVSSVVPAP